MRIHEGIRGHHETFGSGQRWLDNIGLTPFCADKKCPFTGLVSIRGRILTGTVVSTKMHRTLVIRREYLHFIPKYSRYEKRHKNLAAHVSPAFRVEDGDQVTVGQCRPLSKTVSNRREYNSAMETTNTSCRSASTFCACCQELASRSSSSTSSKRGDKRLFCGNDGKAGNGSDIADIPPSCSDCILNGVWSQKDLGRMRFTEEVLWIFPVLARRSKCQMRTVSHAYTLRLIQHPHVEHLAGKSKTNAVSSGL